MSIISQFVGDFASNMAEHGCSAFFFTSAIQSGVFGEVSRHYQSELVENNLEFRERLQGIKDEFQREHLDCQLQFRRESYELSKQFLLKQSTQLNENRQKEIEFHVFLEKYWPLNYSPYSVITEQKKLLQRSIVPLRVIIAQTEISAFNRKSPEVSYAEFCQHLRKDLTQLGNINVEIRPWKKACLSSICEAMNVNYIMQGIPTLIIFPYQLGDTFGIEISTWAFLTGNRSMLHKKIMNIEGYKGIDNLESTYSAIRAVIGMTRDAYMLSEYRQPVCYPQLMVSDSEMLQETREMLYSHYEDMQELVTDSGEYQSLCSQSELDKINYSLDSSKFIKK